MPEIPLEPPRAPGMLLPTEIERTYDRSLKRFIEYWSKRVK